MKISQFIRSKFCSRLAKTLAVSLLATGVSPATVDAATVTFTGGAGNTGNELGNGANWSSGTVPLGTGTDVMVFNGTATSGTISYLTNSANLGGSPGVSFSIAATQGALTIDGTTGLTNALRINASGITIATGAGAFLLGNGVGTFNITIQNSTDSFTNNSSNAATIGSDIVFATSSAGAATISFSGTGNWIVNNNLAASNGGTVTVSKTTAGTVTINGSNSYTGGTTIGAANGSTVFLAAATQALGTGNVSILGNATTNELQLTGGISLNNAFTLSGRSTANATIENISGTNTLSGLMAPTSGGNNYVFQSDSGTLLITNTGNWATQDASRVLMFQGAGNGSFATTVSGSGSLSKANAGTWTLTGSNTYTGATTVSGGTLQLGDGTIGHDGTIGGTSGVSVASGATLAFNRFGSSTAGYVISGSGSVTMSGAGTQTLTGTSTYTGASTVSNGTLQLGDGTSGHDGTIGNTSGVSVASGATLAFNRFGSNSAGYAITGSGSVTMSGAGSQTLGGANSYTGSTSVNSGALTFSGTSSIGSITVADNATLGAKVTSPGSSVVTSSGLTFGVGGTSSYSVDFNVLANPTVAVIALGSGTLTRNGTINVSLANVGGLGTATNTLALLSYGTRAGSGSFNLMTTSAGHSTFALNDTAAALYLNVTAASNVWKGNTNATWDIGTAGGGTGTHNWNLSDQVYLDGDNVIFDDTAQNNNFNVNIASTVTPGSVAFSNSSAHAYVLSGSGIAGGGQFVLNGSNGMVTLTNSNSYTGPTTIGAGDTLQIGDGTTDGSISSTSNVVDNGTLVYNRLGAFTYAGVIGGTGAVVKNGTGTQILSGTNTYSGGTTINNGTLQFTQTTGAAVTGVFNLNGGKLEFAPTVNNFGLANTINLNADSTIGNVGSAQINLTGTINGNGYNLNYAGNTSVRLYINTTSLSVNQFNILSGAMGFDLNVGNQGGGAPVVVSNGGALWIANANSVLANAITLSGTGQGGVGALFQEGAGSPLITGSVVLNGDATIGGNNGNGNVTINGGNISGTGNLTKSGANKYTLSANGYVGSTTIAGGALLANDNAAFGSSSNAVSISAVSGAQLQLGGGINMSNWLTINGGGVTAQGALYVPAGDATYSGNINITGSTQAGNHFATGGGILTVSGSINASVPVGFRIGTVVFTNTNSNYTALNINQGTAQAGATNAIPVGATVTIGLSAAATFDLGGFNQTLAGIVKSTNGATVTNSGTTDTILTTTGSSTYAGVIQDGATNKIALVVNSGALALSGTNTYSGGTTVNGGTLSASLDLGAAGSNVAVNNTGTLALTGGTNTNVITVASDGTMNLSGGVTMTGTTSGAGNIVSKQAVITGDMTGLTGTFTHNNTAASTNFNTAAATSRNAAYVLASAQGSAQGFVVAGNGDYTLEIGSLSGVAGSLFRGGNVATGTTTLQIGNLGTNTDFQGSINNGVTKTLALTKVGAGTLTLDGSNTYTGATNVNNGTLNVNNALASGTLSVAAPANMIVNSTAATGTATTMTVAGRANFSGTDGSVFSVGSLTVNTTGTTTLTAHSGGAGNVKVLDLSALSISGSSPFAGGGDKTADAVTGLTSPAPVPEAGTVALLAVGATWTLLCLRFGAASRVKASTPLQRTM